MATLTQVKQILGITDTSQDAKLQPILDGVNALASAFIDISDRDVEELMYIRSNKNNIILTTEPHPTKLLEINGTDVSSLTEGVDYLILDNGSIQVENLSQYTVGAKFDYFKVKYHCGYVVEPADYVLAIANYTASLAGVSSSSGQYVIEETTGPRTVKWSDPTKSTTGGYALSPSEKFYAYLRKFIPAHLKQY